MSKSEVKLRKIMIVIEETGPKDATGNQPFNLYMAGDLDEIEVASANPGLKTPLGAASWWSSKLFHICVNAVRGAGAVKSEMRRQ